MKVLFIGDIVGRRARNYAQEKIIELKTKLKLDAIIVNVENSAGGFGVTPSICDDFFRVGADVLTTGNHIWDKREIISYITKNDRLLRPLNMIEGTPGLGMTTVDLDAGKIGVANIMTNLFMQKTDNVFDKIPDILENLKLKKNVDFSLVDIHGEASSEKMALGNALDGQVTAVVGTHTHVPTADTRVLEKGTAYQTDIGMCGDYNSVIGMNKENSLKKFFKDKNSVRHFPSNGEGTISGVIVEADENTGLANKVSRLIVGGTLAK